MRKLPAFLWLVCLTGLAVYWWLQVQAGGSSYAIGFLAVHAPVWTWGLVLTLLGLLLVLGWSIKSRKLGLVLGPLAVLAIAITFTYVLYQNDEWHTAIAKNGNAPLMYNFDEIFGVKVGKVGRDDMYDGRGTAGIFLRNYNSYIKQQEVVYGSYSIPIEFGTIATHPPGPVILYGKIGTVVNEQLRLHHQLPRGGSNHGNDAFVYFCLATLLTVAGTGVLAWYWTASFAASLLAALTVVLAPSYLLFSPLPDVLVAGVFVCMLAGVHALASPSRQARWWGGTVAVLGLLSGLMLTFGMLIAVPAIIIYLYYLVHSGQLSRRIALIWAGACGGLSLLFLGGLRLAYGYSYLQNYLDSSRNQQAVMTAARVGYMQSLQHLPAEAIPAFGFASVIAALFLLGRGVTRQDRFIFWLPTVLLILLDLTGVSRLENSRILVFLVPLFAIAGVLWWHRYSKQPKLIWLLPALTLAQTLLYAHSFSVFAFVLK